MVLSRSTPWCTNSASPFQLLLILWGAKSIFPFSLWAAKNSKHQLQVNDRAVTGMTSTQPPEFRRRMRRLFIRWHTFPCNQDYVHNRCWVAKPIKYVAYDVQPNGNENLWSVAVLEQCLDSSRGWIACEREQAYIVHNHLATDSAATKMPSYRSSELEKQKFLSYESPKSRLCIIKEKINLR